MQTTIRNLPIKSFFYDNILDKTKKYLVLGKGPSFEKLKEINLDEYIVIGLNEVCGIIPCDIGHFIDVEVLSQNFINNSKLILCPIRPHINCKVNKLFAHLYLEAYQNKIGKLYCYNCSTWKDKPTERLGQIVHVKYFSAEAVFRILALKGIREIFSLGIDGGKYYADAFKHLKPLQNGRKEFDEQFGELDKITQKWAVNWIRL